MKTGDQYRAHIRQIARMWGIRTVEDSGMSDHEASATVALRVVHIAPVEDERTYVTAMHEIGHVVHPNGLLRTLATVHDLSLKRIEEEAAWQWAEENVLDGEWTPAMEEVKVWSLATYGIGVGPFEPPNADDPESATVWDIFFGKGGMVTPFGPPPSAVQHDPDAVKRRAHVHSATARKIVDLFKKK